jgi:hypothetical protein
MRRVWILSLFVMLLASLDRLSAEGTSMSTPQTSTTQFPGTGAKSGKPPPEPRPAASEQEVPKLLPRTPPSTQAIYFHPGIVVYKDGKWEGNDYLFNLTKEIGVAVEINKPENLQISLSQQRLKVLVEDVLRKEGINPTARNDEDEPGLPFLHIQILIYPIEQGYAVVYQQRLFEAISIKRVNFDRGATLQAITWEKQKLMIVPADQLVSVVEKNAADMTNSFVQLFLVYEGMKR